MTFEVVGFGDIEFVSIRHKGDKYVFNAYNSHELKDFFDKKGIEYEINSLGTFEVKKSEFDFNIPESPRFEFSFEAKIEPEIKLDCLPPENVTITGLCPNCQKIHNLSVPCLLVS